MERESGLHLMELLSSINKLENIYHKQVQRTALILSHTTTIHCSNSMEGYCQRERNRKKRKVGARKKVNGGKGKFLYNS